MALILMLAGVVLMVAGIVLSSEMGEMAWLLAVTVGAIMFILGCTLRVLARLCRKATANEAFVRTGFGGAKVVLDGIAPVLPVFHRVVPVSLETIRLSVVRRGDEALLTGDNLSVDIDAAFYIKVQPEVRDVLTAARSLGERAVNEANVRELVMDKLVAALGTVVATKSFADLHSQRDEFAAAVQHLAASDIEENGLTVESVAISLLRQTPGSCGAEHTA